MKNEIIPFHAVLIPFWHRAGARFLDLLLCSIFLPSWETDLDFARLPGRIKFESKLFIFTLDVHKSMVDRAE